MSEENGSTKRRRTSQISESLPNKFTGHVNELPYFASRLCNADLHTDKMPKVGLPARYVLREIKSIHSLDFSQELNTSSYVNVVAEPEEEQVALMGLKINLADQTVYPASYKLHDKCVNAIAELWNCPKPDDFESYRVFAGAGTVGSTEACLLSGLALKFRWREWYAKKYNKTTEEVLAVRPNIVMSTLFQAAWEKLFKYFDIVPKFVAPKYGEMKIDPEQVAELIDEKTMGVVGIMGNHYGGQYDRIDKLDEIVEKVNKEKGFQVGIHVDGASGGFIAPFQEYLWPWDFRLKNVLSISASGHKFGDSCCGTGWVVWRQRKGLSEHVAISVSYLGGNADSYTLNFSRPAAGVYNQYYKFLRLGKEGYITMMENMMDVSKHLRDGLAAMKHENGEPVFELLDDGDTGCLPVVTAMLNPKNQKPYDDIDLQHALSRMHWYVSGYTMGFEDPFNKKKLPLFCDQPANKSMFRIVVKSNLTKRMAEHLLRTFKSSIAFLDEHGEGYAKCHAKEKAQGKDGATTC